MGGLDGYKGPHNVEETSGIQDIPQLFESQNNKIDSESISIKDQLGNFKKEVKNEDVLLNNKINEVVDVFQEGLGELLPEQELEKFSKLLLESSKKSLSPKIFVDKVSTYIKSYGNDILKTDFRDVIGMVLEEEGITIKFEEVSEKKEEVSEKKEEVLEKKEEIIKLTNSLNGLSPDNEHYGSIVDAIQKLSPESSTIEDYRKITDKLKTDKNAFAHLANDLKKKDPKQFESFRSSLIDLDESFRPMFDDLIVVDVKQKLVLGTDNIRGLDIGGTTLEQQTDDGFEIEAGIDGRKISIGGTEYKLGSKIDVRNDIKEVMEIEKEMKEEIFGLNKTLNSIQGLKKYVNESITNKTDIKEVKENIKIADPDLYNELQLDLVTSLEQVIQSLDYLYNKKEKEKDKILKKIKQRVDEIVSRNSMEAKEKDKKKKKTLKYLNQICFDLFPQSLTNQLIQEYKNNLFNIPGVTLNKGTLDLENGMFGEPFTEKGGNRMNDNLVMFMEKAIYGEVGHKDSIFKNLNFKAGATIVPSVFFADVTNKGILKGGSWNIIKLRENLSTEVQKNEE